MGKIERKDEVIAVYEKIKELGHEVTYDWTRHESIKPYPENVLKAAEYSESELKGISERDVFIYLSDEGGTTLKMELGVALAFAKSTNKLIIYAVGDIY